MSINKIHVNNTTKISLNDRFTVMQSVGPRVPSRARTQSASHEKGFAKPITANRKLLEQLDKKHKMQAALKLKRRSLKTNFTSRQRMRNRIGLKKGSVNAIRLAPNGKLIRSNSLSNIATMKADLVEPTLKRSNSTSSLSGRLGNRNAGKGHIPRVHLNRNNTIRRANSRQNLSRSRSNSVSNLRRSNSNSNLQRRNSKSNINRGQNNGTQNRPNRNRSSSRSRSDRRNGSVNSRLGVRKTISARGRPRYMNTTRGRPSQGGVAQGRITKRRNSTGSLANNTARSGVRRGRNSRPRGRGNINVQRTRSQSRSKRGSGRPMNERGGRGNRGGNGGRGRPRGRGIARPLGLYMRCWIARQE